MGSVDPRTPADEDTVLAAPRLHQFAEQVLAKSGLPHPDADLLARHLVWADLRGISWLGVSKIPQYVERLRAGGVSTGAPPTVVRRRGGVLLVDGHDGFGQVVGHRAMTLVAEAAAEAGIAAAAVRNTTSAGALGYYASLAADRRLIGLAINNSQPLQAAPGGTEKVVGNQAFAIASPASRHPPLLLDMATSAVSLARVHGHQLRGEPLPDGVALTAGGTPTVDPVAALTGLLLPMAGHRGFGLALIWEILTGVLAGGPFSAGVSGPDVVDRPQGVSLFLLALDPTIALPYRDFVARVDELVDRMHGSARAPGVDRITVPGERRDEIRRRREAAGIPIPAGTLAALSQLGEELGLAVGP